MGKFIYKQIDDENVRGQSDNSCNL